MTHREKAIDELTRLLVNEGTEIVVDDLTPSGEEGSGVVLASFHLRGHWESPVQYTFPFYDAIPIEESLDAVRDLISLNWQRAYLPPQLEVPEVGKAAGAHGASQ